MITARLVMKSSLARVFFCAHEDSIVLLHGFIKKTQKTPDKELDLAEKRMRGLLVSVLFSAMASMSINVRTPATIGAANLHILERMMRTM